MTQDNVTQNPTGPVSRVCPFCHAAIGGKCLERVKDGSKYIEYFHPERIVADVRETTRQPI